MTWPFSPPLSGEPGWNHGQDTFAGGSGQWQCGPGGAAVCQWSWCQLSGEKMMSG